MCVCLISFGGLGGDGVGWEEGGGGGWATWALCAWVYGMVNV